MSGMNVLFIAAEAAPFAKVGGMADVVGSLPAALIKQGADARVMMPLYGHIDRDRWGISHLFTFTFPRRTGPVEVGVWTTVYDGVPFYFVQGFPFFGTPSDQSTYTSLDWDAPRFIFFCQAVMAAAWEIKERIGWFPDVMQVNDWHTGLVPFFLHLSKADPDWGKVASVLSIHNMAYQGDYVGGWLWEQGIPGRDHPDLIYQNKGDNLMAMALTYSDMISTVSPRYATEIQYANMGYGLEGFVRRRVGDLYGILNGIDTEMWDPATDTKLVSNYHALNFSERRPANKALLQREAGLDVRADVPVIGVVSRLVWQKGFDLAIPALWNLLSNTDVQFVLLGSGEDNLEAEFARLGQAFGWRAKVWIGYNATVAQHIYAGSDLFLMPSHFEPCGIGQMLAMRYGSLPVVRETGGLADTVQNYDNGSADSGTGFVFNWEQPSAVLGTLRWAVETFYNRKAAWARMQQRAMQTDFSWYTSAGKYLAMYERAIQRRRG